MENKNTQRIHATIFIKYCGRVETSSTALALCSLWLHSFIWHFPNIMVDNRTTTTEKHSPKVLHARFAVAPVCCDHAEGLGKTDRSPTKASSADEQSTRRGKFMCDHRMEMKMKIGQCLCFCFGVCFNRETQVLAIVLSILVNYRFCFISCF